MDVDALTAVPIRMRAGDAVAFSRWTVHGSGANVTSEPRVAYALQCSREDVNWFDADTGEWHLLMDEPRTSTTAVRTLG